MRRIYLLFLKTASFPSFSKEIKSKIRTSYLNYDYVDAVAGVLVVAVVSDDVAGLNVVDEVEDGDVSGPSNHHHVH